MGCATGKQTYATKGEAGIALRAIKARGGARDGHTLGKYLCWQCRGWHLGNKPTRRRLRWREKRSILKTA